MDFLKEPLEKYIRYRFGDQAVLENAKRFTRGSSRLTWFVDYRPEPEAPVISLVFRSDFPGGSTIPTSLEQEYFIYERLGHTEVPAAKAIAWEDDPKWAFRPFFIREQVEGSWDVENFNNPDSKYDALRIAISKEHLSKLALVHNVDWQELGFDKYLAPPASLETCALHFIDTIVNQLESFRMEPLPIVIEAIDWLKKQAPAAPKICLCKGTNGRGEEVFRDGKIVAMSDWEEASIGDPAADFASLQEFIPEIERDGKKLWGLDMALEYYRSVSGINVTEESIRFYQNVRAFGSISFSHRAATITHSGKPDIRQIWTGTEVMFISKLMLAAAMGLAEPPSVETFNELNQSVGNA